MLNSYDRKTVVPIINSIGAYVYLVDVLEDGTFRFFAFNRLVEEDILNNANIIVGKRPEETMTPMVASKMNQHFQRCVKYRSNVVFEDSMDTPTGTRWANHFLAPIFDINGRIVRIMATVIDTTKRKQAEQALQESEERYHALYDDNPARLTTLSPDGTILSMNAFGANYIGYDRDELVGTSIIDYIHPDDRQTARTYLQNIMKIHNKLHHVQLRGLKNNGDIIWTSNTARLSRNRDDDPIILLVSDDITETRELSEELSYQATHDSLTGLVNRREFERRLRNMLETAKEDKIDHALCYLDLDQFKVINDVCGHSAGDELLRQLTKLLQTQIRDQDTLARLGGDEFGVLMENYSLDQAETTSQSLCKAIQDYQFPWKGKNFQIGVSIGVVPVTETSGSITTTLSAADAACYIAKDKGRNRIHVCYEDDVEIELRHSQMEWVNRINLAITENRFHLYFQPIVSIASDDKIGKYFELLLRFEDENKNIVSSDTFMPAAERYGLATRLDQWVVETAFDWLNRNPENIKILFLCFINLSGCTLADDSFLEYVIERFRETNVPPDRICFEITETAAITNLTSAMNFIHVLKGVGCQFSLDDFGSGLSSLTYLKNFPVDYLKIDGAFVKDIANDPLDFAMVKAINDIGHVMGKKTIAEFAESDIIIKKLREIGVDFYQGFGAGKPQPIERL